MANQTLIPLSVSVQAARNYLKDAVAQIMDKTKLPAYLMDGVVCEVLADLRCRELCEYASCPAEVPKDEDGEKRDGSSGI